MNPGERIVQGTLPMECLRRLVIGFSRRRTAFNSMAGDMGIPVEIWQLEQVFIQARTSLSPFSIIDRTFHSLSLTHHRRYINLDIECR